MYHNSPDDREPNDKRNKLSAYVVGCSQKFRVKPSQEFLGHVVDLLDRNLKLFEAQALLEKLPSLHDHFPSLSQIEDLLTSFRKKPVMSREVEVWESTVCPGTPASVEAMFNMIVRKMTDTAAFASGLRYLGCTEDELMRWYEHWLDGKMHPTLARRRSELNRPYRMGERG